MFAVIVCIKLMCFRFIRFFPYVKALATVLLRIFPNHSCAHTHTHAHTNIKLCMYLFLCILQYACRRLYRILLLSLYRCIENEFILIILVVVSSIFFIYLIKLIIFTNYVELSDVHIDSISISAKIRWIFQKSVQSVAADWLWWWQTIFNFVCVEIYWRCTNWCLIDILFV